MQLPSFKRNKSQALMPVTPSAPITAEAEALHWFTPWQEALERWRASLAGRSLSTAATYTSAARVFFETPGAPDLAHITIEALDMYASAQALKAGKNAPPAERIAPATVNIRLAALKAFLLWCLNRDMLPGALSKERIKDALRGITARVQRPYQVIEAEELPAMLQAAEAENARALALVGLALGAGLRISELCALNVGSIAIDRAGAYVDVQEGKGRKDRQVPISEDVYALVAAYLEQTGRSIHRAADRDMPLFLSRKSKSSAGRLCTRQARRIVEACSKGAGLENRKHITPHSLRHSYALRVLAGDKEQGQEGAPLPAVSKLLGHASLAVTGKYLAHFERKDLAAYAPSLRRGRQSASASCVR
jgi:integrase